MKNLLILTIIICTSNVALSQTRSDLWFKKFDLSEVIFTLPPIGDETMTIEKYKEFVAKYWKNEIPYKVMAFEDTKAYRENKKGSHVAAHYKSEDLGWLQFRIARQAIIVDIGRWDKTMKGRLAQLAYGISLSQYMLETRKTIKKRFMWVGSAVINGGALKTKTLLIPDYYKSKKVTEASIKAVYPYKFEFASAEKIDDAILNQDENVVVVVSTSQKYIYQPSNGSIVSYFTNLNSTKAFKEILKYSKIK
jgi:hypothetical protein